MKFPTHRVVEDENSTKLYSLLTFNKGFHLVGEAFMVLFTAAFSLVAIYAVFIVEHKNSSGYIFWSVAFILMSLVTYWRGKNFIKEIQRAFLPILILGKHDIELRDIYGKTLTVPYERIREIRAKIVEYKGWRRPIPVVQFSIVILKKGNVLIDVIYPKRMGEKSDEAIRKELKGKCKVIGEYLDDTMCAPYFWRK